MFYWCPMVQGWESGWSLCDPTDFTLLPASRWLQPRSEKTFRFLIHEIHVAAFHPPCKKHPVGVFYKLKEIVWIPYLNIMRFLGMPFPCWFIGIEFNIIPEDDSRIVEFKSLGYIDTTNLVNSTVFICPELVYYASPNGIFTDLPAKDTPVN